MKILSAFALLLTLAALPLPCRAAVATLVHSEQNSADSAATSIACPAISTTTGNLLVIFFRQSGNTNLPSSVADTAGNTFHGNGQADISGVGGDAITHYYAYNITGNASNVVTVTWGGNESFRAITCLEFSGVGSSDPLDQVVTTRQSSSTSITSGSVTTTQNDEIIAIGVGTGSTSATYTPDTGYTLGPTVTSKDAASEYKVVSSIQGGITPAMSADVTTNWGMVVATFKSNSGGGGTPIRHRVIQ